MGYVATKGGYEAIAAAEELVERKRVEGESNWLELDQIIERLRLSVDRVMGEGGLWSQDLAARAIRQSEGDVNEASHLLRAHRATLSRFGYTDTIDADEIEVMRRVVPAFREPPGPQLLGRTLDYTGRLIDRRSEEEQRCLTPTISANIKEKQSTSASLKTAATEPAPNEFVTAEPAPAGAVSGGVSEAKGGSQARLPGRLIDALRAKDALVERRRDDDPEPFDISRAPARPGAPRSAQLSAMARAETGALVNIWYRSVIGPDRNINDITLGEVRHGRLPVRVQNPVTGENVTIGKIRVTEVEAIEDLDLAHEDVSRFDVGYAMCIGHNERKAIAMANLDIAVHRSGPDSPLEQLVLMTTDGLEASGFLEHLKLPHYVTFRSMMERKEAIRAAQKELDSEQNRDDK